MHTVLRFQDMRGIPAVFAAAAWHHYIKTTILGTISIADLLQFYLASRPIYLLVLSPSIRACATNSFRIKSNARPLVRNYTTGTKLHFFWLCVKLSIKLL
jgi:hypothetical protein